MAGIYIHVPFCITKCPYCDFYSVQGTRQLDGFVKALCREIELRAYELSTERVETIYWGGGTPSLLRGWQVKLVMDTLRHFFQVVEEPEVTMECNPGDLGQMDIQQYLTAGVNRFSIGAQSFDPQTLKFLRRRHAPQETLDMYYTMRWMGIQNISLDLMYGIPGSDLGTLQRDLDKIIELRPEHVSTYHLIYEPNTPLFQQLQDGQVQELPEELSLKMSHTVVERLTEAGYEHYEIANFSLPGFHSRHNSSYWEGTPYVGFGPSAHSYFHPWRSSNPADIREYNDSLFQGARFLKRHFEYISSEIAFEEYLLTHLRTRKGISLKEISAQFGTAYSEQLLPKLEHYLARNLLQKVGERYTLTHIGIDISDAIIADLI